MGEKRGLRSRPSVENPRGFYENIRFRALSDRILDECLDRSSSSGIEETVDLDIEKQALKVKAELRCRHAAHPSYDTGRSNPCKQVSDRPLSKGLGLSALWS